MASSEVGAVKYRKKSHKKCKENRKRKIEKDATIKGFKTRNLSIERRNLLKENPICEKKPKKM